MKLYGSLQNRIEENRMYCKTIEVGTGVTEYSWSDRHPYEVIEVRDQKHITVRAMDHKHIGEGTMDNSWELVSNENNAHRDLEKRGDVWYWTNTLTAKDIEGIEEDFEWNLRVALAGFDINTIREKGKQTKRYRANISFGVADYYYDYEF